MAPTVLLVPRSYNNYMTVSTWSSEFLEKKKRTEATTHRNKTTNDFLLETGEETKETERQTRNNPTKANEWRPTTDPITRERKIIEKQNVTT